MASDNDSSPEPVTSAESEPKRDQYLSEAPNTEDGECDPEGDSTGVQVTVPDQREHGETLANRGESFSIEFGSASKTNLQDAFLKYRKQRQKDIKKVKRKRKDVPNEARLRAMADPERMWQLRMKFLEQAKKYFGVPYAKKYWKPEDPEYSSKLFLDCCGLVRRVMRDLKKDFGFQIGPWNQAYMCDTLPITVEREEDMKPGDLVFISGTYYNSKMKKQKHSMTHVEIWLGEGQKTIGARWHKGKVQIFDSYQFESTSYHSMKYIFKSIDTWLMGICRSHCPEHAWRTRAQKFIPSKKSVFALPVQQNTGDSDESAGDCSGEEAVQSAAKEHQKEEAKKPSESTSIKKVKKAKRSSKSAQPRLIGASQTPRLSEKVRLPLSADSKRSLMKSRTQQQQLVLQSLGVQGKSFGQRRDRYCQNFMSKPLEIEARAGNSTATRHSSSVVNGNKSSISAPCNVTNSEAATSGDVCSAISGIYHMTMWDAGQSDVSAMMLAQKKDVKQDFVQLFTLPADPPIKANLFPPINQLNRSVMATQFGCGTSARPTTSESTASTVGGHSQCWSDDGAATPFPGTDLLEISENDPSAEEWANSSLTVDDETKSCLVHEGQTEGGDTVAEEQTTRASNDDCPEDDIDQ